MAVPKSKGKEKINIKAITDCALPSKMKQAEPERKNIKEKHLENSSPKMNI